MPLATPSRVITVPGKPMPPPPRKLIIERLPAQEREMTEEEQDSHDYRAACKRCFVFIQNNLTDEDLAVAPDIADYYKGEAFIILEEFTLSLMEFPRVNNKSLSALEYVAAKTEKAFTYLDPYLTINLSFGIQTERKSLVSFGMLVDPPVQLDQLD